MVVYNDIVRDSRVLKLAAAMRRVYADFTLVGTYKTYKPDSKPKSTKINGLDCMLFPNFFKIVKLDDDCPHDVEISKRQEAAVASLTSDIDEFIAEKRPSCLHTHDMYTLSLGSLAKRRADAEGRKMFWIHDVHENARGASHMPPLLQKFAVILENAYIEEPDLVITVTDELAQCLEHAHPQIKSMKVVFNTPEFVRGGKDFGRTLRGDLGIGSNPIAVYLGQVKPLRGVERMLDAMPYMPALHYAVLTANKGEFIDEIKHKAGELGVSDRVHFMDYVPPAHIVEYIQSADIGVNPLENYGNADVALPNKMFDYIFAGLPVISHTLEAPTNFFQEYAIGKTADFDKPQAVANAVSELLDMSAIEIAKHRKTIAESYSWEIQESNIVTTYLDILGFTGTTVVNKVESLDLPDDDLKIIQGITGAAGQPNVLARQLDRQPGITARSLQITLSKFGYASDLFYPVKTTKPDEMAEVLSCVADDFDIFHIHGRGFIFDRLNMGYLTGTDFLALRAAGKKVIIHFRGSEVRLASEFAKRSPYNYVNDDEEKTVSKFPEHAQREYIEMVGHFCNRVLVNDPEIQSYVPGSTIVERALEPADWPFIGLTDNPRPLVVHAPSRMGVKGTSHVLAAVDALRADGLDFDFELVSGLPHHEARALYEKADIIVDQLRIGWYGVLSVEAMALGKPVIAYIREDLEHHLGPYPPLVTSTPDTISADLRRLIKHPEVREEFSKRGRAYFEAVHSADVVVEKLKRIYAEVSEESGIQDLPGLVRYLGRKSMREEAHLRSIAKERDGFRKAYRKLKATSNPGRRIGKRAADRAETRNEFVRRKYRQEGKLKATGYFIKRLVGQK